MKKHSDGYYYEKEVEYKRNKNSKQPTSFFGAFFIGMAIAFLIHNIINKFYWMALGMLLIAIFIYIIGFFETHDRKVKYRRIGK